MRIDKYLWCIRIYKTRSLATDACKSGKIILNDIQCKPSLEIKNNDVILIKKGAYRYAYKIISIPSSRVAAILVKDYCIEITSEDDKKRNEMLTQVKKENAFYEFGKPTKKDRREMRKFRENEK